MDIKHPALEDPHVPTRRRVLVALKILGQATAQDLARLLHITPMGVRRHLASLEDEGLVTYKRVRHGQGRPRHVYELTPKAHAQFDQRYAALSIELLNYVRDTFGEEAIWHLFSKRAQRRAEELLPLFQNLPLEERVARLAEVLNREGYLAEWSREDGAFFLCEHHCAIQEVAKQFPQACATEEIFLRRVLGDVDIQRREHIVRGDTRCAYIIRPKSEAG
ncbi:MAG: transcriptional regulator [Chloroflexi bacterium]|nr:transcriptional regulator [Chloroflexota bacterium]